MHHERVKYTVFGTPVSAMQQHTTLGLPITADLDFTTMVQDRKVKVTNDYHAMRPFVTRSKIPDVIRSQMVRSVLVPITTHGLEPYGTS